MAVNCVSLYALRAIAFVATIFVSSVLVTSIFVTSMPGASAEESNSLPRCTKKRVGEREVYATAPRGAAL